MINKVWFWLAIIGLLTALSIDLYDITFVKKTFATKSYSTKDFILFKEKKSLDFIYFVSGEKYIKTINFPANCTVEKFAEILNHQFSNLSVKLEKLKFPNLKTNNYFKGIKNAFLEQLKGDEKEGYVVRFYAKNGKVLSKISLKKPLDELKIKKRNLVYNTPFEPFSHLKRVTQKVVDYSKIAVNLAIGLIGIMALWLGLMKIAEEAGAIQFLAKKMAPIMKIIFPDVPPESPAMGAMLMNISANILGLGNAATPLGLKAMEELQKLNKNKKVASNAMCTFLVINTSGFALIPATVIGIRTAAGSNDPFGIILPVMIASGTATIVGLIAVKILQRFFPYENKSAEEEK